MPLTEAVEGMTTLQILTNSEPRATVGEAKENNSTFEEESLPVDKDLWGNPVEEEE